MAMMSLPHSSCLAACKWEHLGSGCSGWRFVTVEEASIKAGHAHAARGAPCLALQHSLSALTAQCNVTAMPQTRVAWSAQAGYTLLERICGRGRCLARGAGGSATTSCPEAFKVVDNLRKGTLSICAISMSSQSYVLTIWVSTWNTREVFIATFQSNTINQNRYCLEYSINELSFQIDVLCS